MSRAWIDLPPFGDLLVQLTASYELIRAQNEEVRIENTRLELVNRKLEEKNRCLILEQPIGMRGKEPEAIANEKKTLGDATPKGSTLVPSEAPRPNAHSIIPSEVVVAMSTDVPEASRPNVHSIIPSEVVVAMSTDVPEAVLAQAEDQSVLPDAMAGNIVAVNNQLAIGKLEEDPTQDDLQNQTPQEIALQNKALRAQRSVMHAFNNFLTLHSVQVTAQCQHYHEQRDMMNSVVEELVVKNEQLEAQMSGAIPSKPLLQLTDKRAEEAPELATATPAPPVTNNTAAPVEPPPLPAPPLPVLGGDKRSQEPSISEWTSNVDDSVSEPSVCTSRVENGNKVNDTFHLTDPGIGKGSGKGGTLMVNVPQISRSMSDASIFTNTGSDCQSWTTPRGGSIAEDVAKLESENRKLLEELGRPRTGALLKVSDGAPHQRASWCTNASDGSLLSNFDAASVCSGSTQSLGVNKRTSERFRQSPMEAFKALDVIDAEPAALPNVVAEVHTIACADTKMRQIAEEDSSRQRTHGNSFPESDAIDDVTPMEWSLKALVQSVPFELSLTLLVLASTVVMVAEAQYIGIDTGYAMKYPGSHRSARDTWPWVTEITAHDFVARHWFDYVELGLGVIFTLQLSLKMYALQNSFLDDKWNWFDSVIICIWGLKVLEVIGDRDEFLNPTHILVVRLARLLRMARTLRTLQMFDTLHIFVESMISSISTLFWAGMLLVLIQLAVALFFTYMLDDYMKDSHNSGIVRHEVYKYFGTSSRAFLTMFELTLGNWIDVTRVLAEGVNEWWVVFALSYKLVFGFAVLKAVLAIFVCETFKITTDDDHMMALRTERNVKNCIRKMRRLFPEADVTRDLPMNRTECEALLKKKRMRTFLRAMHIEPSIRLFDMVDYAGNGELTIEAFLRGILRLRGPAQHMDVVRLGNYVCDALELNGTVA